jgi:hypothetical protein
MRAALTPRPRSAGGLQALLTVRGDSENPPIRANRRLLGAQDSSVGGSGLVGSFRVGPIQYGGLQVPSRLHRITSGVPAQAEFEI